MAKQNKPKKPPLGNAIQVNNPLPQLPGGMSLTKNKNGGYSIRLPGGGTIRGSDPNALAQSANQQYEAYQNRQTSNPGGTQGGRGGGSYGQFVPGSGRQGTCHQHQSQFNVTDGLS